MGLLRVIITPINVTKVIKEIKPDNVVDVNNENIKEIIIEKIQKDTEKKLEKPLFGKRVKNREKLKNKFKKEKVKELGN